MTTNLNNTHAIPTVYAGVNFRSRIEARWAAFFDLARWRWDYEPLDFRGYIPDFALSLSSGTVLVEVKSVMPGSTYPEEAFKKLDGLEWHGEFLLLGAGHSVPRTGGEFDGAPKIGMLGQRAVTIGERIAAATQNFGDFGWCWDEAVCPICSCCGRLGLTQQRMVFGSRTCSCDWKKLRAEDHDNAIERLTGYWREAGNRTQWRAR